ARGLHLRQLAHETRISTAVIEAIERGWGERLPEAAYLRTMLPLLEQRLELPAGSLAPLLDLRGRPPGPALRGAGGRGFRPGSIELFSSWQGTLIYGMAVLGLIHALNLQQWHLAASQQLTLVPLPAQLPGAPPPQASTTADDSAALLGRHPELRPLRQAAAGVALARLRREQPAGGPDLSLGRLTLRLERPTRLVLSSGRDGLTEVSRLEGVRGDLDMPVLPPFDLRLDPPPAAEGVRWRGAPLAPAGAAGNRYRYPPAAAAAAAVRP
ncbi:MAG: helix-turn-helix domain-containing protein, partial [Prochlorococcaceae cyanobacterium]